MDCVKDLLGEMPVLMPETAIHRGFYTGWHKDTTSQEKAGHRFHYEKEALMMEAGFYLQDNDDLGGGLTVMPVSHTDQDIFHLPRRKRSLMTRVLAKMKGYNEEEDESINPHKRRIKTIPSKAGDLVIFNFLLNHRATRPRFVKPEEIPVEKSKLAFFNAFAANNSYAKDYLDFLYSRKEPFYQALKSSARNPELSSYCKKNAIQLF